jgi:hypothetical protein
MEILVDDEGQPCRPESPTRHPTMIAAVELMLDDGGSQHGGIIGRSA